MEARICQPASSWRWCLSLAIVLLILFLVKSRAHADLRVTAYYPGYKQSLMPASNIDFSVVTDLIHFSVVPKANGTLDSSANGITKARSADVVSRAHAAQRNALICAGGASSESGFLGATTSANLPFFVSNLVSLVVSNSYDGVDIDWEPLPSTDFNQYTNLLIALRVALDQLTPPKLLTVAAAAYPPYPDFSNDESVMYASIQDKLDQINLMTYDLSGAYSGWVTWFNSPIYDGDATFPRSTRRLPSIDGPVNSFLTNGVSATKLGIGTPFYGVVWRGGGGTSSDGVTWPQQSWTSAPTTTPLPYSTIVSNYYSANLYHWDSSAQAAFLSVTNSAATNDEFISYDDEHSTQAKVSYARNHGLGGLMIWELSQDYLPGAAAGSQQPLLESVRQALATPRLSSIQVSNLDARVTFTTAPLGVYRVVASTNFSAASWATLTNNMPGDSNGIGAAVVSDPGVLQQQSHRFYRVQTPP